MAQICSAGSEEATFSVLAPESSVVEAGAASKLAITKSHMESPNWWISENFKMEDESIDICAAKNIANESLNPIADAGISEKLEVNGQVLKLEFKCLMALSVPLRKQLFTQLETNVREFYEIEWGWNENERKKELFAADSKFILLYNESNGNELVGWSMFKFDWDDLDEPEHSVLFCYELHVSPAYRGLSIGTQVFVFQ